MATVSKEVFHAQMEALLASKEPFDVVMLSYNLKKSVDHSPLLLKVLDAQTASGYLVSASAYTMLIELYERTLPDLERFKLGDLYANDQVWKKLQPSSRWYAFRTRLGIQRPGFSDTTNRKEDYKV